MLNHQGPPLMLNRAFLHRRENVFKLLEILMGILTIIANAICFPNQEYNSCDIRSFTFLQSYQIFVFNIFCLIFTIFLAVALLFGFYDSFYKFNLYTLERLLVSVFFCVYLISLLVNLYAFYHVKNIPIYSLPSIATLVTTLIYGYDTNLQWKNRQLVSRY